MHKEKTVKSYIYIHIPMGRILGDFLFHFSILEIFYNERNYYPYTELENKRIFIREKGGLIDRHINHPEILPLLFSFCFTLLLSSFLRYCFSLVSSIWHMVWFPFIFIIQSENLFLLVDELIQFMFGFSSVISFAFKK